MTDPGLMSMGDIELVRPRRVSETGENLCALCGSPDTYHGEHPVLMVGWDAEPICRVCAQKHHPEMVALQDLATELSRWAHDEVMQSADRPDLRKIILAITLESLRQDRVWPTTEAMRRKIAPFL